MIIGLYLLIPILRKITENKKIMQYFMFLGFIFALLIPFIGSFPKMSLVSKFFSKFKMSFVLNYLIFFVAGYYFNTCKISKKIKNTIYVLGIVSVIFTVIATYYQSLQINKLDERWYSYFLPTTACTALAVFLFLKSTFEHHSFRKGSTKIITTLSACSFGIYLVHLLVKDFLLMQILNISYEFTNSIVSIPLITICCFLISFVIIFIISKIPILNKYIM